jgi:hypothetical protein
MPIAPKQMMNDRAADKREQICTASVGKSAALAAITAAAVGLFAFLVWKVL